MASRSRGLIIVDDLKVAGIRGAGELGDVGRCGAPDVVPVHGGKEGVALEVVHSLPAKPGLGLTDQPGGRETHTLTLV